MLTALGMILTLLVSTPTVYAEELGSETGVDAQGFTVDSTGAVVSYEGVGGDITIPSTATSIASDVFASNTSITSVTIPANIAIMGTGIFANCTSLSSVSIQGNISEIPAQTFYNCANLTSVSVPVSVTSIGTEAFAECVSLTGISIPAAVATIGERAFYDCYSLSGVLIPSAVSSIGSNAFAGCTSMTAYSVDSGNAYYASSDGCLYNKTMTKLLNCPEGKTSVTIYNGTKIIGSGSFYNCVGVNMLTIPSSVTTIETNAFSGSGISSITIPASVTSMGSQSNWTADIVYGYDPSTAETYASTNSIVFESLGTTIISDDPEPDSESDPAQDPGLNPNPEDNSATVTAGGTTAGTTSGTTASSGTTTTATSVPVVTSASHEKDSTPKTGDGINPVFFLCIALLLVGIYFVMMSKKKEVVN